jgi:hypothetical protein
VGNDVDDLLVAVEATQVDLAAGDEAVEQHRAHSSVGKNPWVLTPEFPVEPLDHVRRADRFPLLLRERIESEQVVARLVEALDGAGAALGPQRD